MYTNTMYFSLATNVRTKVMDFYPISPVMEVVTISSPDCEAVWEFYFDKTVNELQRPLTPLLTLATTGGNIPRSTKIFVRVTTLDVNGIEGIPSEGLFSITTGSTTDTNKITVKNNGTIIGAVSDNVYAGTIPGWESLVGNFIVGGSYEIIDIPPDIDNAIGPVTPDIHIYGKKSGIEPLSGFGEVASTNIKAFVTQGAPGGRGSISFIFRA